MGKHLPNFLALELKWQCRKTPNHNGGKRNHNIYYFFEKCLMSNEAVLLKYENRKDKKKYLNMRSQEKIYFFF